MCKKLRICFKLVTLVSASIGGLACSSESSGVMSSGLTSDIVGQGRAMTVKYQCATCHADASSAEDTLSGRPTPQPATSAYPANLTPDDDTGIGTWSQDLVVRAILHGVDDEAQPLCPPMPHFADRGMSEDEAAAIAMYLRSLPPRHVEIPESSCPPLKGSADAGVDPAP